MDQASVGISALRSLKKASQRPVDVLSSEEVQESIDRITEFCAQYGWEILYSNNKHEYYQSKEIHLYQKRTLEIQYYILLHEVGHAWMLECDFTYPDRYPELSLERGTPRYATITYKIAKVQEEIEAWEVGKKLARSCGLRINQAKFEKTRAESLRSYLKWAGSKRKRKKNAASKPDISKNLQGTLQEVGRPCGGSSVVLPVCRDQSAGRQGEADISGQEPSKHPGKS